MSHHINDALAMAIIHRIMSQPEWSPDTLNEIADVVRATGRTLK